MATCSCKELLIFLMMMYIAPSHEAEDFWSNMALDITRNTLGSVMNSFNGRTLGSLNGGMNINLTPSTRSGPIPTTYVPTMEINPTFPGNIEFVKNGGVKVAGVINSDESQDYVQKKKKKESARKKRRSSNKDVDGLIRNVDVRRDRKHRSSDRPWKINSNNGKYNSGNRYEGSNIKIGG